MTKKNLKTVLSLFIAMLFAQINYGQTVTIGSQVWTSKNLDVSTFRNGDPIPQAKTAEEWEATWNNKKPAWCYYENDHSNGKKYGKLYNWYAVKDPRGLAPKGFHIPSDTEWTILVQYLGQDAGKKMKRKKGWHENGNGTDSSGFSGRPGGRRGASGAFDDVGKVGRWWSSTEYSRFDAWYCCLSSDYGGVTRFYFSKEDGLSVRCLRD